MTPDEIVKALRENAEWCDANEYDVPLCMGDNQRAAADLIESLQADLRHEEKVSHGQMEQNKRLRKMVDKLQANLAESQRRERAAVGDLKISAYCRTCSKKCGLFEALSKRDNEGGCKDFEWRGPQEAGKGDNNGNVR